VWERRCSRLVGEDKHLCERKTVSNHGLLVTVDEQRHRPGREASELVTQRTQKD
jgi:hypothetical protein